MNLFTSKIKFGIIEIHFIIDQLRAKNVLLTLVVLMLIMASSFGIAQESSSRLNG